MVCNVKFNQIFCCLSFSAYDNGFKSCYLRWDKWFYRWDDAMAKNEGGYTIPVMLAIGNHEVRLALKILPHLSLCTFLSHNSLQAGAFGASLGDDPYYTSYFPQKVGLQEVHPRYRLPYHSHRQTKLNNRDINNTWTGLDPIQLSLYSIPML